MSLPPAVAAAKLIWQPAPRPQAAVVRAFAVVTGFGSGRLLPALLTSAPASPDFSQRGRGTGVWTSAVGVRLARPRSRSTRPRCLPLAEPSPISSAGSVGRNGMTDDEMQIRRLIERWAGAVHEGDLGAVLAHHADDVVMFDVPPPDDGVRGIETYRETWPPFFVWQQQGAVFDITELRVTAGRDVAFAWVLLRCGDADELARHPGRRLRLTIGLRKQDGRWIVTHEHHSFPIASPEESDMAADASAGDEG